MREYSWSSYSDAIHVKIEIIGFINEFIKRGFV